MIGLGSGVDTVQPPICLLIYINRTYETLISLFYPMEGFVGMSGTRFFIDHHQIDQVVETSLGQTKGTEKHPFFFRIDT